MTGELSVAVIGAGYFAQFHLEAWGRIPGARLRAVCDRDTARLAPWQSPQCPGFDDAERMLDEVEPALIDIATPPRTHLALVRAAATRGIPAICQKPLAPTYREACELVDIAVRAGTTLIVHENIRWAPWHRRIGAFVSEGNLGAPHRVSMRLRPGDGQGPDAYLDRQPYFQAMPRFLIHETAIHWVDVFRFLMGEVTGVFARLGRLNPAIAGEDCALLLFEFDSGASAIFDGNRLNDHVSDNPRRTMGEMWLEGSEGVLRLDGAARLWWKPHRRDERELPYSWSDRGFAGDAVHSLQSHVVAHLREGTPVENSGIDYLRNLEIEEALYCSAASGKWIDVSR